MRQSLGESRSRYARDHALVSPDSHERTTLPHWSGAETIFLITPQAGARFSLFLVTSTGGLSADEPPHHAERVVLVRSGRIDLTVDGQSHTLDADGYAYLPAGVPHQLRASAEANLIVLERPYRPAPTGGTPKVVVSSISKLPKTAMKGDERLQLQKLLPGGPEFDMELNIMDFAPGASLPYVETHFMEHGLVMLNGGGIYRLGDQWYSVEADDAIWMGPFCPQWFGAIGRENARYLIYKNWNRDPLDGGSA
ncbi:(S)-ureidoglycine aminohydrolase [Pseudoruegeria sp. SK021]|uniref:(S)-ureidoglycine aminohydrolase n=1 Tax=Pseudoruegeria sp. SK021 TaxID=1933035 RepID=UPI000A230EC9|nr:(S)-ureidoglycine aminohydrolase [Pseudoruegeria sp. SK021]OSP54002.1 hypothetical protein BV911_14825 [Pseudoruegeria sp. SK021]